MRHKNDVAGLVQPERTANQDFPPRDLPPLGEDATATGWNAYDVWRVRIKAVFDARDPARPGTPGHSRTK